MFLRLKNHTNKGREKLNVQTGNGVVVCNVKENVIIDMEKLELIPALQENTEAPPTLHLKKNGIRKPGIKTNNKRRQFCQTGSNSNISSRVALLQTGRARKSFINSTNLTGMPIKLRHGTKKDWPN